jgi:hypothetical protein
MEHEKKARALLEDADKYGTDQRYMIQALAHAVLALTAALKEKKQ